MPLFMPRFWAGTVLLALAAPWAMADRVYVAAASNFREPLKHIVTAFEADSRHKVVLSTGSTGKLYAQIRNGAPFEVFLAADIERPALLEKEGAALPGTRFTYARGRLVLWSPKPGYVDDSGAVLDTDAFRYLAMPNPKLAPYGKAAQQVLEARGRWDALRGRIAQGENISQAHHFIVSGNADLGFLALSQVKRPGKVIEGSYWLPPAALHDPIDQQAILVKDTPAARAFLEFLKSAAAKNIIQRYGYELPPACAADDAEEPAP